MATALGTGSSHRIADFARQYLYFSVKSDFWRNLFNHFPYLLTAGLLSYVPINAGAIPPNPAGPMAYSLNIHHQLQTVYPLDRGRSGVELRLNLSNDSDRNLSDLRITMVRATPQQLSQCAPANLKAIAKRSQEEITWTFECKAFMPSRADLREVLFRVEAIDEITQKIVSLVVSSRETN